MLFFFSPFLYPRPHLEDKFSLLVCQAIKHPDTPVESSSTYNLQPPPSSEALPPPLTPSTTSFVTTPDSAHEQDSDIAQPTPLTPAVVMETIPKRYAPQANVEGPGSLDVICPELEPKLHIPMQDLVAETEDNVTRRGRHKGAHSFPPLQSGAAALLFQLKTHRQVEVEGGGAKALWRAVFSGNRKEKKRGGTLPPGANRVKRETANWRKGDDAVKKHSSNTVVSQ